MFDSELHASRDQAGLLTDNLSRAKALSRDSNQDVRTVMINLSLKNIYVFVASIDSQDTV